MSGWGDFREVDVGSRISGETGGRGAFEAFASSDEKAANGTTKVCLPANVGIKNGIGREETADGATVEDEDENRDDDGEWSSLVKARSEEEAEVTENEGAGANVVGVGLTNEPNENASTEGGGGGDDRKISPASRENGGTENEERNGISEEVAPAIVEKGGEEDSL